MFDCSKYFYIIYSFISSLYAVFYILSTNTLSGIDHSKDEISESVKQVSKVTFSPLWCFLFLYCSSKIEKSKADFIKSIVSLDKNRKENSALKT